MSLGVRPRKEKVRSEKVGKDRSSVPLASNPTHAGPQSVLATCRTHRAPKYFVVKLTSYRSVPKETTGEKEEDEGSNPEVRIWYWSSHGFPLRCAEIVIKSVFCPSALNFFCFFIFNHKIYYTSAL